MNTEDGYFISGFFVQLLVLFSLLFNLACVSQAKEEVDQEPPNLLNIDAQNEQTPAENTLKVVFEDFSSNFAELQLEEIKVLLEKYLNLNLQISLLGQDELFKLVLLENFDLLFINPLTYAYIQSQFSPILQTSMDGNWYSNTLMVTRQQDNLTRIEDLTGKRVLFGSSNSLHSYLWPMNQIIRKSLDINNFSYYTDQGYTDLEFINQVLSGQTDAAFIKSYSINWGRKIELAGLEKQRNKLDFHNLGEPIPTNLIALNRSVDASLRIRIRETLLELTETELFTSLLKDYGWGQLRITDEETYENVINAYRLLASYLEHG